jgi:hypothetical protein
MEHDTETCGICNGSGNFMGNLADMAHYRCRDCGDEWGVDGAEGDPQGNQDDVQDWEDDCFDDHDCYDDDYYDFYGEYDEF